MDIVRFFKELSDKWNREKKCGFCWTFKAPLSESGMNTTISEESEKCCVHLFLTDIGYSMGYKNVQNSFLKNSEWCDCTFTIYVVKKSNIGINIYNEMPYYSIEDSVWQTILNPIRNCIGCGNELELCEMGYNFEIIRWDMKSTILQHDDNYTGWKITGIFRQKI